MQGGYEVLEEDIRDLIEEAKSHLHALSNSADKTAKYSQANDAIGYALKLLHDYRIQASAAQVKSEKDQRLNIMNGLQQEIHAVRENLLSQRPESVHRSQNEPHFVGSTLTIARDIQEMQEKSLASLKRSEQVVTCTEELAVDASERLRVQRDKFYEINEGLDTIGSQIQRARREMNAFVRRMMRDKVIVFFALLIFVAIVIALAVKYRNRRKR